MLSERDPESGDTKAMLYERALRENPPACWLEAGIAALGDAREVLGLSCTLTRCWPAAG